MNPKKETDPDWSKIVNDILATKQAQEWVDEPERKGKFGLNEYYFSEHSLALAILEQFEWEEEFFEQHPELKAYLDKKLEYWWDDQIDDPDVFEGWWLGNKIMIHPDAYVDDVTKILMKEYRKRITETHDCSKCGAEISEAYPMGHEQHIYRVGVERINIPPGEVVGAVTWRNDLFCKKCFYARMKK